MPDLAVREHVERAWKESRWALGLGPDDGALAALVARYEEPHRRYHDLGHISACLALLEAHRSEAERIGEVIAAVLFHDVVYDPRQSDNESRSAELAVTTLERAGAAPDAIHRIDLMIRATRDHQPRGSSDTALLLDVDLSILGESLEVFDRFDAAIRDEYAFVPEDAYRRGRRAVLEGFAARERIFHTEAIRHEREALARANLTRILARY